MQQRFRNCVIGRRLYEYLTGATATQKSHEENEDTKRNENISNFAQVCYVNCEDVISFRVRLVRGVYFIQVIVIALDVDLKLAECSDHSSGFQLLFKPQSSLPYLNNHVTQFLQCCHQRSFGLLNRTK